MKIRETKNGNIKLTLTHYEADVITSVLSHVRLGTTENSEVIFNFLENVAEYHIEPSYNVEFDYSESEGHVLNV